MLRIVKTKLGTVEGIPAADPRITAFKSVPFAKPPVGNLPRHSLQSPGKEFASAINFLLFRFSPPPTVILRQRTYIHENGL